MPGIDKTEKMVTMIKVKDQVTIILGRRKYNMKKISVLIPCYNEEENVVPISEAVIGIITKELPQYDYYELVFIDND